MDHEVPFSIYRLLRTTRGIKDYLTIQAEILDKDRNKWEEWYDTVEELEIKVRQLDSKIGHQNEMLRGRFTPPVIWDAFAGMSAELALVEPLLKKKEKKMYDEISKILGTYKSKIQMLETLLSTVAQ